ncbi:MAG: alanine--tRNA ligase [Vicinamibacterales bacterium]
MTSNEIRRTFLEFFQQNGHRVVASSPLVPGDDPTLLFTNAGMNQFKDVFLGREKREYTRATTSQKVMRVSGKHNDLDNVGPSLRHHTFFEMLGNFSFGDYFKAEAIEFAWRMLTEVWKMPADRLVVSIFKGENGIPRDAEAYDIWRQFVPAERILELGSEDNFWQMGETGPCGRCSEIYFVRGTGTDPEIEIWNNVFMEFERSADGTLTPLPAPCIDTGMGLERITAVLQNKQSNYDTDLFMPLLTRVGELAGVKYGDNDQTDISMRVVADHSRATTFLIADGVIPSNEWRGYVLRKIMRRAMRHGKHLGLTEPFLHEMVAVLAREMGDAYPELRTNRDMIEKTITAEENRFDAVLKDGLPRLETEITKALESSARTLPGDVAFRLYDTFGVPYDFIEDTAATRGASVDREAFERAMEGQRDKARAQSAFGGGKKGQEFAVADDAALSGVGDQFEGYTSTTVSGVPVVALFDEGRQPVDSLAAGATGFVALAKTPFYLEAGGQVSDSGLIINEATGMSARVEGLARIRQGLPRAHRVRVESGTLAIRDIVTAQVDSELRNATRRNHTATHLLHAALRQVLGTHVKQAGSLVAPDRLRFDFVHFQPVTREELDRIERIVNEQIVKNTAVSTEVRSTEDAIASGAMALFGEKYGDRVRVVSVPGFSVELCGGTHVSATGDIGSFQIVAESGVAAGVRRIEAITGMGAVAHMQEQRAALQRIVDALHASPDVAVETIERLQTDAKKAQREISQLKTKLAMGGGAAGAAGDQPTDVNGVRLIRKRVADLDKDALRGLADSLKSGVGSGVVVIASENDGKVQMVVAVTPDLTAKVKAGAMVKALAPIVGGGGGGRPDFAEAGGKLPEKIDEMLAAAPDALKSLL